MSTHKYSKKKQKKNHKYIAMILTIVVIVIILITAFVMTRGNSAGKGLNHTSETISYALDHNLEITSISSYTGPFLEDGSDEEVSDILAITLTNNGTQTLQYAELTLAYAGGTGQFAFSTLAPGEEMLVLESNRLSYDKRVSDIDAATLDNVVFFDEEPTLCPEKVQVQALDGALNIGNITDGDITGRVIVYYKNYADGMYQGGITYRVVIEDGIEAGGITQVMTTHFSVDDSKIVFVTYEQ